MADAVFQNRLHRSRPYYEDSGDEELPFDDIGSPPCLSPWPRSPAHSPEVPFDTLHVDDMDEAFAAAERKPDWTDLALADFLKAPSRRAFQREVASGVVRDGAGAAPAAGGGGGGGGASRQ